MSETDPPSNEPASGQRLINDQPTLASSDATNDAGDFELHAAVDIPQEIGEYRIERLIGSVL